MPSPAHCRSRAVYCHEKAAQCERDAQHPMTRLFRLDGRMLQASRQWREAALAWEVSEELALAIEHIPAEEPANA